MDSPNPKLTREEILDKILKLKFQADNELKRREPRQNQMTNYSNLYKPEIFNQKLRELENLNYWRGVWAGLILATIVNSILLLFILNYK